MYTQNKSMIQLQKQIATKKEHKVTTHEIKLSQMVEVIYSVIHT